jgi:hypothetical protein
VDVEVEALELETTVETTEPIVTTLPDLDEDVFPEGALEVLHTGFTPSEELESEIMELIHNYGTECSVYMVNLEDYATFGYNSDTYMATASTIKCPYALYCYQQVAQGNHSLDDTLQYTSGYYTGGTGVIQNSSVGTYYTVRDLLYYMIHYSDNIAYLMLLDYFGYEGYNAMLSDDGFETYLSDTVNWGKISSHALGYYWTEIYKFKDECEEGSILFDTLLDANTNLIQWALTDVGYDYQIAHKGGWASPGYHDSGLVLSEHPYVIVVMTNSEGDTRDSNFLHDIVIKFNELHDEYLQYLELEPSQTSVETTTVETTTPTETTTTTPEETTVETTTEPTTTTTITTTTTVETTTETLPPTTTVETTEPPQQYYTETYIYEDPNQNTQQYQQYEEDNLYF